MPKSPALHPFVRERREPRMSATSLAEYLILRSDQQDTVLHDSRYSRPPIVSSYGDAFRALRAYNIDPARSIETLERAKRALTIVANSKIERPKAREEAQRCIEAIELFDLAENHFGMRSMALSEPPTFHELIVEGVKLSIHPDFLVTAMKSRGGKRIGCGMLRLAKAPDPNACRLESTRQTRGEHRREMGRYLVAMMQMLLEDQASSLGDVDRDLIFVADVRLGERIVAAADHAARLRAIRSACDHIRRLWATVTPRSSVLV